MRNSNNNVSIRVNDFEIDEYDEKHNGGTNNKDGYFETISEINDVRVKAAK